MRYQEYHTLFPNTFFCILASYFLTGGEQRNGANVSCAAATSIYWSEFANNMID